MNIESIEAIINLMKKNRVLELEVEGLSLKLDPHFEEEIPEELKEKINKMMEDDADDEEILMNPYVGLEH